VFFFSVSKYKEKYLEVESNQKKNNKDSRDNNNRVDERRTITEDHKENG